MKYLVNKEEFKLNKFIVINNVATIIKCLLVINNIMDCTMFLALKLMAT